MLNFRKLVETSPNSASWLNRQLIQARGQWLTTGSGFARCRWGHSLHPGPWCALACSGLSSLRSWMGCIFLSEFSFHLLMNSPNSSSQTWNTEFQFVCYLPYHRPLSFISQLCILCRKAYLLSGVNCTTGRRAPLPRMMSVPCFDHQGHLMPRVDLFSSLISSFSFPYILLGVHFCSPK